MRVLVASKSLHGVGLTVSYSHFLIFCGVYLFSQIIMTTGWWLLLLLVISSQSVDSRSTTDDETCSDGGVVLRELQRNVQTLLDNQLTVMTRLRKF